MAEDESEAELMVLLRGLTTKLEGMDKRLTAELEGMGTRLERIESHMGATPTVGVSASTNSIPKGRVSLLDVQEQSTHDARPKLPLLSVGISARRASGSTAGKVVPLPSNSSNNSGAESAGATTPTPLRKRGETRSRSGSEVSGSEADKSDDETAMELTSLDRLIEQAENEVLGAAFDSSSAVGEIKLSLAFDIFCALSGCGPCPPWWSTRVHTTTRFSAASAGFMCTVIRLWFLPPKATQWEVLEDRGLVTIAFEVWGFHDHSWSTRA